MKTERRIHKRIYFTHGEEIPVNLSVPGVKNKTIQAKIMDLSEGGMAISYQREHDFTLKKGEFLSIQEVQGVVGLKFIENKMMEAIWVHDSETFETIGVGCEFRFFNEANKKDIKHFIEQLKLIEQLTNGNSE